MGVEQIQSEQVHAGLMPFPLPANIEDRIAVNSAEKQLFTDKSIAGDPLLLTWLARNQSAGIFWTVSKIDVDEVAKKRSSGMRIQSKGDEDMKVRLAAMEIIKTAADYGASDIHFMLRGDYTEIQIVVKGSLRVLSRSTQAEGEALTRAIYQGIAKTRDSSYNPLEYQNAQIPGDMFPPSTGLTSLRIVRGPCYPQATNGAFMTIRLQYGGMHSVKQANLPKLDLPRKPEGRHTLPDMGYTESQIAKLVTLMNVPSGVIIFTGPTGSGKTTSLFESLQEIARIKPHRRLVTVEDPVEMPMDWAVQMAVTDARNDAETGAAFSDRIRVALRMAPNIILVGEIRGPEVAIAALEASVTGHQVFTTLHIADPFLFPERLELMDRTRLERRLFCDHNIVRGVIAQRLLPKLCPHCSSVFNTASNQLQPRIVSALATWGELTQVRLQGHGCAQCNHDGTSGRFAVAEVVVTDAALMGDFIEHGSETARNNYRARPDADGSMLELAIAYVLDGKVDPRAVEDGVDLIVPKEKRKA